MLDDIKIFLEKGQINTKHTKNVHPLLQTHHDAPNLKKRTSQKMLCLCIFNLKPILCHKTEPLFIVYLLSYVAHEFIV